MSNSMRLLLGNIEDNNVLNIMENPYEREASKLRMNFFKKYITKKDTNAYKTKTERDYAYTAKREYQNIVQYNALTASVAFTLAGSIVYSMIIKRTSIKPSILLLSYFGFDKYYLIKHNKRLFDMCNVGEETELGYQRNLVLRECNKLLDREDF